MEKNIFMILLFGSIGSFLVLTCEMITKNFTVTIILLLIGSILCAIAGLFIVALIDKIVKKIF